MRIVWDEPKRLANIDKHGIDFADLEHGFDWDTALFLPARSPRYRVLGLLDGRLVAAIVSPVGSEGLAVISVRAAGKDEKGAYDGR